MNQELSRSELIRRARRGRIVVKIGSGVLADPSGRLDRATVRRLAADIAPLCSPGRWPYVVSSGAIAVGVGVLGLKARPRTIPGLQAAAAVGQSKLVEAWAQGFRKFDVPVAQVLLTHADLADRRRFLNARRALGELERRRAVAIINENDTVSFEEIAVGDNDGLAAQVSNLVDAELLVLLSVAPGILDGEGRCIAEAAATDPKLDEVVHAGQSLHGRGGMRSKLKAARMAAARGATVAIVEGKLPDAIPRLLAGEPIGTVLFPAPARLSSRDHWIAHTLRPAGQLEVDAGALRALTEQQRSLLPKGIVRVVGEFEDGDPVDIVHEGQTIARGLTRYTASQLRQIAGHASESIEGFLGFTLGDAAVHRDDLVVFTLKSP